MPRGLPVSLPESFRAKGLGDSLLPAQLVPPAPRQTSCAGQQLLSEFPHRGARVFLCGGCYYQPRTPRSAWLGHGLRGQLCSEGPAPLPCRRLVRTVPLWRGSLPRGHRGFTGCISLCYLDKPRCSRAPVHRVPSAAGRCPPGNALPLP